MTCESECEPGEVTLMLILCSLLHSLNLPGSLQALEKPLGLPSSLTSHAAEVRQQQGLHKLRRTIHEIEMLKNNDYAIYEEGVELLRAEAAENEAAIMKYGTDRWTRISSRQASRTLVRSSRRDQRLLYVGKQQR